MTQADASELTRDDIWSMLGYIPAHDYDNWIRIGMALKSHLGDSGWSLFDEWSQNADNYNASSARSTWRSLRGQGIGIGTLVFLAKQNGWCQEAPITAPLPALRQSPKSKKSSTARYAAELWLAANKWIANDNWLSHPSPDESVSTHPYAIKKDITSTGGAARGIASGPEIGKNADCIIVPIRDRGVGKVQAVECINAQGRKCTFGPKSGGYLLLGNHLDKSIPWYICEGWASAYSMVWHHEKPNLRKRDNCVCAVSFGKSNLDHCAEQVAAHHAPDEILILLEQD